MLKIAIRKSPSSSWGDVVIPVTGTFTDVKAISEALASVLHPEPDVVVQVLSSENDILWKTETQNESS